MYGKVETRASQMLLAERPCSRWPTQPRTITREVSCRARQSARGWNSRSRSGCAIPAASGRTVSSSLLFHLRILRRRRGFRLRERQQAGATIFW